MPLRKWQIYGKYVMPNTPRKESHTIPVRFGILFFLFYVNKKADNKPLKRRDFKTFD